MDHLIRSIRPLLARHLCNGRRMLSRELWELDPLLLLFICVPLLLFSYMSLIDWSLLVDVD